MRQATELDNMSHRSPDEPSNMEPNAGEYQINPKEQEEHQGSVANGVMQDSSREKSRLRLVDDSKLATPTLAESTQSVHRMADIRPSFDDHDSCYAPSEPGEKGQKRRDCTKVEDHYGHHELAFYAPLPNLNKSSVSQAPNNDGKPFPSTLPCAKHPVAHKVTEYISLNAADVFNASSTSGHEKKKKKKTRRGKRRTLHKDIKDKTEHHDLSNLDSHSIVKDAAARGPIIETHKDFAIEHALQPCTGSPLDVGKTHPLTASARVEGDDRGDYRGRSDHRVRRRTSANVPGRVPTKLKATTIWDD